MPDGGTDASIADEVHAADVAIGDHPADIDADASDGSDTGPGAAWSCVGGTVVASEPLPLDLQIVVQQSASMAPAFGHVKATLDDFIQRAAAAPSPVAAAGIAYTPEVSVCSPPSEVPITVLQAGATALRASLSAHSSLDQPSGIALAYLKYLGDTWDWAAMHPTHQVAVLLVTDGTDEKACGTSDIDPTPEEAIQMFFSAVRTFVLGVGTDRQAFDSMANSGGTQSAVMTGAAAAVADGQELFARVSDVSRCTVRRPASASDRAGLGRVNVRLADGAGSAWVVPLLPEFELCDAQTGWFYDQRKAPGAIVLCPASCNQLLAMPQGHMDLITGCTTVCGKGDTRATFACNDGLDNDQDGLIDMDDPTCLSPCDRVEKIVE